MVIASMAFSVAVPLNDLDAEKKIADAFKNDPGASPNGTYIDTPTAINMSANYPDLRFLIVGNKHDCKDPIDDFFPSPDNTNKALALAHAWQKSSPKAVAPGKDVMGGNGAGEA